MDPKSCFLKKKLQVKTLINTGTGKYFKIPCVSWAWNTFKNWIWPFKSALYCYGTLRECTLCLHVNPIILQALLWLHVWLGYPIIFRALLWLHGWLGCICLQLASIRYSLITYSPSLILALSNCDSSNFNCNIPSRLWEGVVLCCRQIITLIK